VIDPHVIAEEELNPILTVLTSLQWPISFEQGCEIIEQLGWSMFGRKTALSTLPVSLRIVGLGALNGELSSIDFSLCDTVKDADEAGRQAIADEYPRMVATVTSCLGFEPTGVLWGHPGAKWDLANGARVNLPQGLNTLLLEVWSPTLAGYRLAKASIRNTTLMMCQMSTKTRTCG